jgi:hypothetical protein
MSAPQDKSVKDYLRLLRPLRALRMVFSKVRGGELFGKGSKPHPFSLAGKLISGVVYGHVLLICTCSTPGW